jgi:hypothetical protein
MSALTKDKLIYSAADAADSDQIGSHVLAGDDGTAIGHVSDALKVSLTNASVAVTATDLDIRDLVFATDKVDVSGSSVELGATTLAALESITVVATDLDIRDLTHVSDSIKIGDGTDLALVSAAGELSVIEPNLTALKKLEDAAHASGDAGIQMLAVRNDAGTSLVSADGDYAPLQVNAAGKLMVAASVTLGSEYAEDAAHSSGATGNFILAVANHTQGALHSADGDYAALQVDSAGRLRVMADLDLTGDLTADDAADNEDPLKVGSHAYNQAVALGAVTADDKVNLASDLYRRVFINDAPSVAVASSTVAIGTSEVALPTTALAGRTKMVIQNTSSNPVYVGATGLTTSTGIQIAKGATLTLEIGQSIALFGIAGSAANTVRIMELA